MSSTTAAGVVGAVAAVLGLQVIFMTCGGRSSRALPARHQRGLSLRDSDPTEAASLFEQACDHGFAPSCLALADQLESGDGVAADPNRAEGLLEQACMDGSTMACDRLGH